MGAELGKYKSCVSARSTDKAILAGAQDGGIVMSGADLSQDSAVLWLRQKLFEATKERGFVRSVYRLELVLRYWNAYIEDKTMTRHFTATRYFPEDQDVILTPTNEQGYDNGQPNE